MSIVMIFCFVYHYYNLFGNNDCWKIGRKYVYWDQDVITLKTAADWLLDNIGPLVNTQLNITGNKIILGRRLSTLGADSDLFLSTRHAGGLSVTFYNNPLVWGFMSFQVDQNKTSYRFDASHKINWGDDDIIYLHETNPSANLKDKYTIGKFGFEFYYIKN